MIQARLGCGKFVRHDRDHVFDLIAFDLKETARMGYFPVQSAAKRRHVVAPGVSPGFASTRIEPAKRATDVGRRIAIFDAAPSGLRPCNAHVTQGSRPGLLHVAASRLGFMSILGRFGNHAPTKNTFF